MLLYFTLCWCFLTKHEGLRPNLELVGCCWALVGSLAKCWCLGDGFPCSNRPRPLEKNACS